MLQLNHVFKTYRSGDGDLTVLNDVSLSIERGEFVALMGPSGSGKSTMMNILGLLDTPTSGQVMIDGVDVTQLNSAQLAHTRSATIGFVFQQFNLLRRTSALDNVLLPTLYRAGIIDPVGRAKSLLQAVGLSNREDHTPAQLSGGQQQRVAIARAMMNDPDIILADEPTGNLDSKSQQEIMALFRLLHSQGKTIILVTHESEVAEFAHRIVTMRDGQIVSDEPNPNRVSAPRERLQKSEERGTPNVSKKGRTLEARLAFSFASQAVKSLTANPLRTILSMLGILIGVAALVAMLALGKGAQRDIQQRLAGLGSNLLVVSPGSARQGAVSLDAGAVTRFTMDDASAVRDEVAGIKRVAAVVNGRGRVKFHNRNASTWLQGVMPAYAEMRAAEPTFGRFFTEDENHGRQRVAVVGMTVVRELFGDESGVVRINPIGERILIDRTEFQVIGILPEKGSTGWRDQDDVVVVPLATAMNRLLGKNYVDSIEVEVLDRNQMESVQDRLQELLRRRHRITNPDDDSFRIRNLSEVQDMLNQTNRTMSMLLASIAVISLIVGGIGIMNIMLVSVIERTREIGLRKALGATQKVILQQFLVESVMVSGFGGLLGIGLGVGVSFMLSSFAGWTVDHSGWGIPIALGFSVGTGIVFGMWPAKQAASLDPIVALRYE